MNTYDPGRDGPRRPACGRDRCRAPPGLQRLELPARRRAGRRVRPRRLPRRGDRRRIGKIDEASHATDESYLVVDTGPWIFGKKVHDPGRHGDPHRPHRPQGVRGPTKDQVKASPEFDADLYTEAAYRDKVGGYYDDTYRTRRSNPDTASPSGRALGRPGGTATAAWAVSPVSVAVRPAASARLAAWAIAGSGDGRVRLRQDHGRRARWPADRLALPRRGRAAPAGQRGQDGGRHTADRRGPLAVAGGGGGLDRASAAPPASRASSPARRSSAATATCCAEPTRTCDWST